MHAFNWYLKYKNVMSIITKTKSKFWYFCTYIGSHSSLRNPLPKLKFNFLVHYIKSLTFRSIAGHIPNHVLKENKNYS